MTPAARVRRALAALLTGGRPGALEIGVASLLLALLGLVTFGSHILNGGFLMDDWSNASKTQSLASCCGPGFSSEGRADYLNVANDMLRDGPAGYHIGLPVIVPIAHFFFGVHFGAHLALAIALAIAMSCALYAVLRTLGVERLHSGLIAGLVLLFPFMDSVRLWAMASYNQLAVILYLVGVLVALRGLRERSARRATRTPTR